MLKFSKIITLLLVIFLSLLKINAEPSTADSLIIQKFDVVKYFADIDLTNAFNKEISGYCDATVHWLENTDEYFFHLIDLKVDSVLVDGILTEFNKNYETNMSKFYYKVQIPDNARNDTSIIRVYYNGLMSLEKSNTNWGGVHQDNDMVFAVGVGMSNSYVSTTRHWLPCYDHPSDKAECEFKFKVKNKFKVASNGLLSVEQAGIDEVIYHWNHHYPTATYLMTFAVSEFEIIESYYNELPIMIFTRQKYKDASQFAYSKVPKMLEVFEEKYGKYPFDKVGYVNTKIGAMEHQTMVTMDESYINNLFSQKVDANLIAAHELSHQWFGNMVSPATFRDAWLNEGFATFSEAVWAEGFTGDYKYFLSTLKSKRNSYFNNPDKLFPLVGFSRETIGNYPSLIYDKGALVVGMLCDYIETNGAYDSYEVIQNYLNDFKNQSITSDDLQKSIENHTSLDLEFFFNQWIYGNGYPILDIEILGNEAEKKVSGVRIKQVQPKDWGIFEFVPVEIVFNLPNSNRTVWTLFLNEEVQEFESFEGEFEYSNFYANNCEFRCPIVQINSIKTISSVDEENVSNTEIFFNQNNKVLSIENGSYYKLGRILITDIYGKVIYDNSIENNNKVLIDFNSNSSGVYLIKIINGNNIKQDKFIILN